MDKKRIEWALDNVRYNPHLWCHDYKGTPISILSEVAKEFMEHVCVEEDGLPPWFDAAH